MEGQGYDDIFGQLYRFNNLIFVQHKVKNICHAIIIRFFFF